MKTFVLLFCLFISWTQSNAQRKKDFQDSPYGDFNVEYLTTVKTIPNVIPLKVWAVGKTKEEATIRAKRNAVAVLLFRGVGGSSVEKPLLGSDALEIKKQNEAFFEKFFAPGGEYNNFVNMPVPLDPADIVNIKKIGYEVAAQCHVNYVELRSYIEKTLKLNTFKI